MIAILLALCVFYCILFPAKMAGSVADGLVLWYSSVLPTLLPLSIFSNIIIQSGLFDTCFSKIHRFFQFILPVRPACIYPLIAGFLFGFPMGSKICADLFHAGKISRSEAENISCISNNFGPAFLCNYMIRSIHDTSLPAWAVLFASYAPALILGRVLVARHNRTWKNIQQKIPPSRSQIDFKIIDAGIMDGFTTMIKLAGYIILFAMLADIVMDLPIQNPQFKCICIGFMEITNGIHAVAQLPGTPLQKYILNAGLVNLGGLCGLFQTASIMKSTGFRIKKYILFKLQCSILGIGFITALYLFFTTAPACLML